MYNLGLANGISPPCAQYLIRSLLCWAAAASHATPSYPPPPCPDNNSAAAKNGALTYASESSKAAGRAHEGATQEWFEDGTGTVFMEQGRLDAGGEVCSLTVFVAKLVGGGRAK